jgi:hypothetical protein
MSRNLQLLLPVALLVALLALCLPASASAAVPPPTLADLWAGRALIAPTFEVVRGVGPGHQRVSFVAAPDGQLAAYGRARCDDKNAQAAPYCIYRALSADGLRFDEAGRGVVLALPDETAYDPSVLRLPNGAYLMAYENDGRWIGLAWSADGAQWRDLGRAVSSCAGDPGLCEALGGAPGRPTSYGRYSVSTPGLAARCEATSCTVFLYFAPRVTPSRADDQAQLGLGLLTFRLELGDEPRPRDLQLHPELVLSGGAQRGAWDRLTISAPSVTAGGDGALYMLYEGSPSGFTEIGAPWGIGLARSTDGARWQKYRGDGLLLAATQPRLARDRPNLERGARSYPGFYTFAGRSYITMAYRGADDELRSDYTVRYQLVWRKAAAAARVATPALQRATPSYRLLLPWVGT